MATFHCSICISDAHSEDKYTTGCNHDFCVKCLFNYLHYNKKSAKCPLCRADISDITNFNSKIKQSSSFKNVKKDHNIMIHYSELEAIRNYLDRRNFADKHGYINYD